jgi:L-iditol 2-dehydrogenase
MTNATCEAAVLEAFGANLTLRAVNRMQMPEPDALIVRVDVATLCGSDVHTWRGNLAPNLPIEPPLILGHEIVGIVEAIGPGAEKDSVGNLLSVGDRVIWEHEACGHCHWCSVAREPTLCPNRRVGMFANADKPPYTVGGLAQYSYVWPRSGRVRVPDSVKSTWASAASCALRTVIMAFERTGPIDPDSIVVIQGAGPLGLFGTAVASTLGPAKIITVGGPQARLDLAREWGAHEVISVDELNREQRAARLLELTGGKGADVLFEMSGAPGAFAEGIDAAGRNARYCVVGTLGGEPQAIPVAKITTRNLKIIGSLSGDVSSYQKAIQFLDRHRARFDWDKMFSAPYPLSQATLALERLRGMEEIKPTVAPWLTDELSR